MSLIQVCRGVAIVMAALLPAAAAAQEDAAAVRGRQIVVRQCARCHAVERTGASALPKAPPFRDIGRRYPVDFLAEALAEGIVTGHAAMPVFRFEPTEIDAILAYLRSLQAP